jgi:inosine-uridine nucleoside N-ribohydrolase
MIPWRELELVTLGPLTNLAMALHEDRSFAEKVKGCVMMCGGAITLATLPRLQSTTRGSIRRRPR